MQKHALLLRVNPNNWPKWEDKFADADLIEVWFKTGRRKPADIMPDIPVIILGTNKGGIIARGLTTSEVEYAADPDWKEMDDKLQKEYQTKENRVCVKIKRVDVPLTELKQIEEVKLLDRRRETTTWINREQYECLDKLISQFNR